MLEVPEEAVCTHQGHKYLWVVGDRNMVERRAARIGQADDGMRVIEEGVRAEDLVVIAGANRLKPGDQVEPRLEGQRPAGTK